MANPYVADPRMAQGVNQAAMIRAKRKAYDDVLNFMRTLARAGIEIQHVSGPSGPVRFWDTINKKEVTL